MGRVLCVVQADIGWLKRCIIFLSCMYVFVKIVNLCIYLTCECIFGPKVVVQTNAPFSLPLDSQLKLPPACASEGILKSFLLCPSHSLGVSECEVLGFVLLSWQCEKPELVWFTFPLSGILLLTVILFETLLFVCCFLCAHPSLCWLLCACFCGEWWMHLRALHCACCDIGVTSAWMLLHYRGQTITYPTLDKITTENI